MATTASKANPVPTRSGSDASASTTFTLSGQLSTAASKATTASKANTASKAIPASIAGGLGASASDTSILSVDFNFGQVSTVSKEKK